MESDIDGNPRFPNKSLLGTIIEAVARKTGLPYELVVSEDNHYGEVKDDGEFDGVIGMLQRGVSSTK